MSISYTFVKSILVKKKEKKPPYWFYNLKLQNIDQTQ